MADINILTINGVTLPTPSTMTCQDYDITEAERNAKGIMVMQMIRENVHKIECTWNILRPEQYMIIRNAISPKYNLETEYFIPEESQRGTIRTYAGDRNTPIYMFEDGVPVYRGFSLNLIEM